MSLRPPKHTSTLDKDPLAAALEQEVFNEKASTLSRLTRKLETALARLNAAEEDDAADEDTRLHLRAEAGEALWHVTIQRELCGLREHKAFYDFLGVPRPIRLRMGPASILKRQATGKT